MLKGAAGATVQVLVDGAAAGTLQLEQDYNTFTPLGLPLQNPAGEHDITLNITGNITLDWFRFR